MGTENKGKRFDRAFKIETVRLITEQGKKVGQVAKEIGLHENTLYKWLQLYGEDPQHCFPGSGHMKPEEEALRKFQRQVADLQEENAILKKAVAIFSKLPK